VGKNFGQKTPFLTSLLCVTPVACLSGNPPAALAPLRLCG